MSYHSGFAGGDIILREEIEANEEEIQEDVRLQGVVVATSSSRYVSWDNNQGTSGSAYYIPLSLAYNLPKFQIGIKSGILHSDISNDVVGLDEALTHMSDTAVSLSTDAGSWNHNGWHFVLRMNADANIPTGKAGLKGLEKLLIADPAVTTIDRFGEGWNFGGGPTLTVQPNSRHTFTVGVAGIVRGEYKPDGDNTQFTIDPGDQFIATLGYTVSFPKVLASLNTRFIHEGMTTRNNEDFYDRGSAYEAFLSVLYAPTTPLRLKGAAYYSSREVDSRLDSVTGLVVEDPSRATGDVFSVNGTISYALTSQVSVKALGGASWYAENDYTNLDPRFIPGRTKVSGGLGLEVTGENWSADLNVNRFQLEEDAVTAASTPVKYDGYLTQFNLRYKW